MNLIKKLIDEGWLKTPEIIEAFKRIKRIDFLPENMIKFAELNEALPIGFNQTISQPLVVAFMMELLSPKSGEKILDIGSGSGWTSALLAYCVSKNGNSKSEILSLNNQSNHFGTLRSKSIQNSKSKTQKGKVIAIEIIPELKEFGYKNASKYSFTEKGVIDFICADGSKGYPKKAPYDKILCSAQAKKIPRDWKDQLKIGGKIVVPIEEAIWEVEKKENDYIFTRYPGFSFVPLIGS